MVERVELADLIRNVRHQLQKAQRDGRKSDLQFKLSDVELELQVTVEKDGKGGVSLFALSGDVHTAREAVQKVRLKMTPVDRGGEDVQISDESEASETIA